MFRYNLYPHLDANELSTLDRSELRYEYARQKWLRKKTNDWITYAGFSMMITLAFYCVSELIYFAEDNGTVPMFLFALLFIVSEIFTVKAFMMTCKEHESSECADGILGGMKMMSISALLYICSVVILALSGRSPDSVVGYGYLPFYAFYMVACIIWLKNVDIITALKFTDGYPFDKDTRVDYSRTAMIDQHHMQSERKAGLKSNQPDHEKIFDE